MATPEDGKDSEDGGAGPGAGALGRAADRLRDAARWLVVSFGAVAAVVFAGITVTRFGDLDPQAAPGLFATALAGAVAAMVGALAALLLSISLASASIVSLADLTDPRRSGATAAAARAVARDPLLAPWDGSLRRFTADIRGAHERYQGELRAWRENGDPGTGPLNRASERLTSLGRTQAQVLETASFVRLAARFASARWWLAGWLGLAAVGAGVFAWATSPVASDSVPEQVTTATWAVPEDDRGRVTTAVGGDSCAVELDALPVLVLDTEDDGDRAEVVTVPSGSSCDAARLVVDTDQLTRPAG